MNFWRELIGVALERLARLVDGKTYHDEVGDVREFRAKFRMLVFDAPGNLTTRKLEELTRHLQEELDELKASGQDLPKQADALVDLVYVAKGIAVSLGLPWEDLWDEVHRANMAKVPGTTPNRPTQKVDAKKPPGWLAPQLELVLESHGYDRSRYYDNRGAFREQEGRDDVDLDELWWRVPDAG